ncbi:NADH-ubiquinone oxidoreductase subunit 8 [Pyrolobus fumarii 1A]|uniref:NADH-ubiquinone oxidoreductase subunit 8 n=1 Tax=Pyrolobus fumarii (strain DSM 11204 / 1A) TaxID=694429 RepID=G0ED54_PYRF1|nr:NADH-ubiquinone oxidoreductase subunit 8 [Pyrolobus fumarii 1A]
MKLSERMKCHLEAVKTGFAALRKPPLTLRYPDEYEVLEGFRGPPVLKMDVCLGCSLCAQICPARAIKMYRLPGFRTPRPGIDYTRCIFCGFCVDICPGGALEHANVGDVVFEKLEEAVLTPLEWASFRPRPAAEKHGRPVRSVVDEEVGLRYESAAGGSGSTHGSSV